MIKVKVKTFLSLAEIIGGKELEVELPPGSILGDLLSWLVVAKGKRLAPFLFPQGSSHPLPSLRLLINGQDIAFLNGRETALQDGDEILIIPPVAGG